MARGVTFITTGASAPAKVVAAMVSRLQTWFTSTNANRGAAMIGLADSAGYFTATDVEDALAELGQTKSGVSALTDPGNAGAIGVTRSGCVPIVTAAAETRTLAIPRFINQRITLYFQTDGGDCVVTVASAINVAGNTIITLNDAGDSIQLVASTNGVALCWRVAQNDGCALS